MGEVVVGLKHGFEGWGTSTRCYSVLKLCQQRSCIAGNNRKLRRDRNVVRLQKAMTCPVLTSVLIVRLGFMQFGGANAALPALYDRR